MTMDFSHLHTYTPPQCLPENTGYTYSLSSSYSSDALDFEIKHNLDPVFDSPKMSRRSLRLHHKDGSPVANHSFISTSGSVKKQRDHRSSRESKTTTKHYSSTSLQQTSRRSQSNNLSLNSESHVCANDLSLTMLDESSIQEKTLVGSIWGLDEDQDLKGADATFFQANGDLLSAGTQTTMLNGYICNDCSILSERKDVLTTHHASQMAATTVYSRNKSQTQKLSNIHLLGDSFLRTSKYAAASLTSLVMQILHHVMLKMGYEAKAHSCFCGSMNVKDLITGGEHLGLNGSLCDDCKGKKHYETQTSQMQSSRYNRITRTLWHIISYTGHCLLQVVRTLASAGWFVTRKVISVLWLAIVSPGKAVSGAFWWLGTGWYQLATLMSLLNVFILTRCLPKLFRFLLLLIPLLLLLGLLSWSPSSLLSMFHLLKPEMQTKVVPTPSTTQADESLFISQEKTGDGTPHPPSESLWTVSDAGRITDLEKQLALVSARCQKTTQLSEEQHNTVVALYNKLQEKLEQMSDKQAMSLWITSLFNEQMTSIKEELKNDDSLRSRGDFLSLHHGHELRIIELEKLLKAVAAKAEIQRQQETLYLNRDGGSERIKDDGSLMSEIKRLEMEISQLKVDLNIVKNVQPACEKVDAQVKDSLKVLLYGAKEEEMPDSFLQWLSTQFVRKDDLQEQLAALEIKILKNITVFVSETKEVPSVDYVKHIVDDAGVAGVSEEQVRVIVNNALKLYSEDKTGLVDYALESGGGSILSTRCSETYETKTALMSLFGFPLWYFSQSPRVVIQPDVYPGNCWAFKGSQGYLVIRLSLAIYPTAFSVEHIPKSLSPTGNISSAPKDFTAYGLEDENQEEGTMLVHFTYDESGAPLQTFPVTGENPNIYQIIEIRVTSNWGHPEYTCLYRVRVHGTPNRT
ncbi:SUN domain-containing protein 1-like isoform X1 [Polypterus senegalus]|uniref:SUN domain-containing protein 1-like isoform X1 n=2 Tax=Polypterus senegalus TaxID=55291 RepID=UPI00196673E8|nr:SUN domain-containing protein 1-like isoform X1 [Polypterus senegalus]XP_039631464.1 SUN domain-containing protein 1-like isoform X1 [Polypterus senegalus]